MGLDNGLQASAKFWSKSLYLGIPLSNLAEIWSAKSFLKYRTTSCEINAIKSTVVEIMVVQNTLVNSHMRLYLTSGILTHKTERTPHTFQDGKSLEIE